ncbi:MAG: hypothetical protein DBX49_01160 [Clostridia bacterium]|nr:MAG: hypothetical protein DBX49_01160 [Clostridia bacterium]
MGTTWEQIETQAMTYIKNDLSLDWDMANRLPVYYNRMAGYMRAAIPKFNRPPAMLSKLKQYTAPLFDDFNYTAPATLPAPASIQTGKPGYELCAAGLAATDSYGNPSYTPLTVTNYDSATGEVSIAEGVAEGQTIAFDFYRSGSFAEILNDTEADILAYCIYNVWEHRFDNDAIERQSKIRDSSFTTISEASQTDAGTRRQKEVDSQLFAMMRAYEQNLEYFRVTTGSAAF